MKIKDVIKRLLPRRAYVVLDKRGASNLFSQLNFFKEEGYAFLFNFLNNSNGVGK